MSSLYVIDTVSIICYFNEVFGVTQKLSNKAIRLVRWALITSPTYVKLSIPSVVFIEIYEKWCISEEMTAKVRYEVFNAIKESPNIEVRPIDREVLEYLPNIRGNLANHDLNDKIIVASALALNCPLITTDSEIIKYAKSSQSIPGIVQ
jgi:predicted nucleic acid-binding protein